MLRKLAPILLLVSVMPAALAQGKAPSFILKEWEDPKTMQMFSYVSVKIGSQVHKLGKFSGGPNVTSVKDLKPPVKGAVAAAATWWAGAGYQFYVVRKGKTYEVYSREVFEESSKPEKPKLLKKIKS